MCFIPLISIYFPDRLLFINELLPSIWSEILLMPTLPSPSPAWNFFEALCIYQSMVTLVTLLFEFIYDRQQQNMMMLILSLVRSAKVLLFKALLADSDKYTMIERGRIKHRSQKLNIIVGFKWRKGGIHIFSLIEYYADSVLHNKDA